MSSLNLELRRWCYALSRSDEPLSVETLDRVLEAVRAEIAAAEARGEKIERSSIAYHLSFSCNFERAPDEIEARLASIRKTLTFSENC